MEWRRGVYGYSTTMSVADLQTGDEIVRRLWWVQQVFCLPTWPYPIGSAINRKLVGDCRDTSSLSVRRPCRKVVNWVYHTSISFVATRICCWQRKKKLRHLPPYTTPISATSTTLGGIGVHHSTVTLETGKLDTTFSHKTARLSRLSFRRARHQRPGGICSLAQLVVRDALYLAISETWELGTSQINYRTLPGNLPHRSRACFYFHWTKHFLADIYIYIHIYNYTNTHESSRHYKMEGEAPESVNLTSSGGQKKEKNTLQYTFFSLSFLSIKQTNLHLHLWYLIHFLPPRKTRKKLYLT